MGIGTLQVLCVPLKIASGHCKRESIYSGSTQRPRFFMLVHFGAVLLPRL
jgi:hypothetical protein